MPLLSRLPQPRSPRRRTTWPAAGHKVYPYLLRNVEILRPDQVWC